jgi:hypothetical protein
MANIPKAKTDVKKKDTRTRNWAFIGYTDSLPNNWKDFLSEEGLTWACSPLHDKDINETTTSEDKTKKAHYHFLLKFDGKKSFEQVSEITKKLNATIPQPCNNLVGAVRYFLHMDNPEKAQYKREEIQEGGGFGVFDYLALSATEERAILKQIIMYCRANGIFELCDIEDFILDEKPEWESVYWSRQLNIYRSLKSRFFKNVQIKNGGMQ